MSDEAQLNIFPKSTVKTKNIRKKVSPEMVLLCLRYIEQTSYSAFRLLFLLSQQHSSIKMYFLSLCLMLNFLIGSPCYSIWFSYVLKRLFSVSIQIVSCLALYFLLFIQSSFFLSFCFFCKDLSWIVLTILSAKALHEVPQKPWDCN